MNWGRYCRDSVVFLGAFVASWGAMLAFLEVTDYFGHPILKNTGYWGYAVYGLVAMNISWVAVLWNRSKTEAAAEDSRQHEYSGEGLAKALVKQFREMSECHDFQTILRIGVPLSRALWLEGQYATRVAVGKFVEEAAACLGNSEAQARALIDDIGWTSVALSEHGDAEKHIRRGIEIAEKNQLWYLAAKGYRHMAGIAIERRLPNDALRYLSDAEAKSASIVDSPQRTEMIAGIRYGQSEAYLLKGELEQAESATTDAQALFEQVKDRSRAVKLLAQLGKIREKQGRLMEAKDAYRQGLEQARTLDRKDEVLRNTLGLVRIAQAENQWSAAKKLLAGVKAIQKTTPLVFEVDGLDRQIAEIERRQVRGR